MKKFAKHVLGLCILGAVSSPMTARADLLTTWNLITTGNLYAANDAQGGVRVGGNMYVQNTFEAAANLGVPSGPALVVGGSIYTAQQNPNPGTVKVNNGGAVIGGTVNGGTTNKNQNGQAIVVSQSQGGTVGFDSSVAGIGAADYAELKANSAGFLAMASTGGTVVIPSPAGQDGPASFTLTSANFDALGNAVFNLDGESLFENAKVQQVSLYLNGHTFQDGESVIFNVSGVNIDFAKSYNFTDGFVGSVANIIWNFYEAETINLNNSNFHGALLAPDATLTNMNTTQGSVFVKNLGTQYGNGMRAEVHTPYYRGYVPGTTAVPEPSSLAMAGLAVLAGAAWKGRRRSA
ncbi:collagen-binding domain-containing protein [Paludisphaera soli]|uniref:collagen-binding domain-containing protein n=1 Tax=Paludisphaera soli TaxID=2712865 RepID=UPI0013EE1A8E|nr:collagen-binding domain-containing protein [Paludisphaera soli]